MSGVKFTDHSPKVKAEVEKAEIRALTAMGVKGNALHVQEITAKGVVDTGRLRGSATYQVNPSEKTVTIGTQLTDNPYDIYNELGTNKLAARPTLRPAIVNHPGELKSAAESGFKGK